MRDRLALAGLLGSLVATALTDWALATILLWFTLAARTWDA